MRLVSELRRRNVFRMAVLYVLAAWLIMQVAGVLMDLGALPAPVGPWVLVVLVAGFPIALVFSWLFEITPEGLALEKDVPEGSSITHITGRRMDFIVIAMLSAAVLLFAYHTWWPRVSLNQSLAVLPFVNMSGDPEQEYFSDGISEEILNRLARFPELPVTSRSSSFSFKGKEADVRTIAKQLNVSHVLQGSVRRSGKRVRITAQLIDASSDTHVWSESYERELGDILAVQEQIAGAIGEALKVELSLVEKGVRPGYSSETIDADVYDEYLKGRELMVLGGRENTEAAIRSFERALRLDESFAPAHAQLAIAIALTAETLTEAKRKATPHLDRAETLEPNLAEVHGGRALLALNSGDPESALKHAELAVASNPSYLRAMNWLQMSLARVGRYREAREVQKGILAIDPLNVRTLFNYSWVLASQGRLDEAYELADSVTALDTYKGYWAHAQILLMFEGNLDEALSWFLKSQAVRADDLHWRYMNYPTRLFIWIGEYDEARRLADRFSYLVDVAEGRFDEAIRTTSSELVRDPDDSNTIAAAADVLYVAGRHDAALPLYERLRDFVPDGMPLTGSRETTMRLAVARRLAGDEQGARAAAESVNQDLMILEGHLQELGPGNHRLHLARAMLAAFEHNPDRAVLELESAVQLGLRDAQVLDDIVFAELRDDPRFVALQRELDAILRIEHRQVLQLVCFNNPTPENWQPLTETCEGAMEHVGS